MQFFRSVFLLILGIVIGWVLADYGVLPMSGDRGAAPQEAEAVEAAAETSEPALSAGEKSAPAKVAIPSGAQTIELDIRGKYVTLYIGMPKEEVKQLLGRPRKSDIMNIGGTVLEDWHYYINKEYSSDLDIDFENGKLKSVHQY